MQWEKPWWSTIKKINSRKVSISHSWDEGKEKGGKELEIWIDLTDTFIVDSRSRRMLTRNQTFH